MKTKKPKYRSHCMSLRGHSTKNRSFCIPPEICTQILSYLPVKSLLRFRSVSQEWKSIINSRDFSSLHLSHYTYNPQETIVVERRSRQDFWALRFSRCPVTKHYRKTSEIDVSVHCESRLPWAPLTICGNVDGLFLMEGSRGSHSYILWNPSIRKVVDISVPLYHTTQFFGDLLLGFDPSTNDYRVVAINTNYAKGIITLQIMSLNSHSWRNKGDVYPMVALGRNKVYLGGSVYWVGRDRREKAALVSFNMTSETFSHTPLPTIVYGHAPLVVGSMIGLLAYTWVEPSWDGPSEIWVLEDDGCWTKRFKFEFWISLSYDCLVYLNKEGELIWKVNKDYGSRYDSKMFFAFDITTRKKSFVSWSAQPYYVGPYEESLVLLGSTTD